MNYPKLIEKILEILISKGEWQHSPREVHMTIAEIITELMELAHRSNMTFGELLEFIKRTDSNQLPWEE